MLIQTLESERKSCSVRLLLGACMWTKRWTGPRRPWPHPEQKVLRPGEPRPGGGGGQSLGHRKGSLCEEERGVRGRESLLPYCVFF